MKITSKLNISKDNILVIETVLYGIVIILAVYLSINGMLLFKMIPILFITGLISRFIFDRPLLLSFFGFSVSLLIIELSAQNSIEYNFLYSLYTLICLYCGALSGRYILSIYHTRAKKFTVKMAHSMSFAILTIFISIFFNIYVNGDFISYIKAKSNLEKYIEENYKYTKDEYILSNPRYISANIKYYSFNLNVKGTSNYKMRVYFDGKILDGFKDTNIKNINMILSNKFKVKYFNELSSYFSYNAQYIDLDKNILITLEKNVDQINEDLLNDVVNEIDEVLYKLKDFDEYENIIKLNVCIKAGRETYIAEIIKDEFGNSNSYKDKFLVEVFDV